MPPPPQPQQPPTADPDAVSFLAAWAALRTIDEAVRDARAGDEDTAYGPPPATDRAQALASLQLLREVRERLAGWESGLIETARAAGRAGRIWPTPWVWPAVRRPSGAICVCGPAPRAAPGSSGCGRPGTAGRETGRSPRGPGRTRRTCGRSPGVSRHWPTCPPRRAPHWPGSAKRSAATTRPTWSLRSPTFAPISPRTTRNWRIGWTASPTTPADCARTPRPDAGATDRGGREPGHTGIKRVRGARGRRRTRSGRTHPGPGRSGDAARPPYGRVRACGRRGPTGRPEPRRPPRAATGRSGRIRARPAPAPRRTR